MENEELQSSGLLTNIGNWFRHPFDARGNALNWILFLGFVIVVAFLWNVVLIRYVLPSVDELTA